MAMRISGLTSGLDTDAIVQELVSAYSKKTEKYTKEQGRKRVQYDDKRKLYRRDGRADYPY